MDEFVVELWRAVRGVRSASKEKPGRFEKSIAEVWTESLQDALLVLGRVDQTGLD